MLKGSFSFLFSLGQSGGSLLKPQLTHCRPERGTPLDCHDGEVIISKKLNYTEFYYLQNSLSKVTILEHLVLMKYGYKHLALGTIWYY